MGRALATGFVVSACALLVAGVAVATAAALRLLFSGGGRMTFGLTASALLLVGFAVAVAAALAMPNRWAVPRPLTLVLAVIVSAAWPLSGSPALAAVAAVAVVGLALAHDARHPGGVRLRGWLTPALLAGAASALVIAGVALAQTHRVESAPVALAPERSPSEPSLGETPAEDAATDAGAAEAEPEATAAPSDPAANDAPTDSPTGPDANDTPTDSTTSPGANDTATDSTTRPDAQDAPTDTPTAPDAKGPSTDSPTSPDAPSSPAGPDATTPTDPGTTTSPSDPAATAPSQGPVDFVRGYYEQLNAKRFADAWASLSPAVQQSFGGLEHWRKGYGRTISSTPSAFKVDGATVTHVLTARDRGCPDRRFRVRWRLEPAAGTWTVTALSASALDDVACS